ncbi:MAG: hypothetical protein ACXQTM_07085, partial [Methanosarcinales archaeon]
MSMRKISSQKKLIGNNSQQTLFAVELSVIIENLYPSGSEREEIEKKFKDIMHEELKLGSLVSYVGNKNIPFLRIYR